MKLRELYELLSANYVEDDDASFRFQYSAEFLRWYVTICISLPFQLNYESFQGTDAPWIL